MWLHVLGGIAFIVILSYALRTTCPYPCRHHGRCRR